MNSMSPETKRVFVGLVIKAEENSSFTSMLKKLRITADRKELDIKWVPKANLHLTLKFIGEVEAEKLLEIREALRGLSAGDLPRELDLRGLGGFPDEAQSRVVWTGVANDKALRALQAKVEERLAPLNLPEAQEPFSPHITIGRLRNRKNIVDFISPFVRKDFGSTPITRVTLFESRLQGHYPVYIPLEEYPALLV